MAGDGIDNLVAWSAGLVCFGVPRRGLLCQIVRASRGVPASIDVGFVASCGRARWLVVRRGHRIQNKVDCFYELPGTIFEPADASPSDSFGKQSGPFVWFHGAGQSGLAASCVLSDRSRFEDCPVVGRHALRFGASLLFVISSACRGFPCRIWQPWSSRIGCRQVGFAFYLHRLLLLRGGCRLRRKPGRQVFIGYIESGFAGVGEGDCPLVL